MEEDSPPPPPPSNVSNHSIVPISSNDYRAFLAELSAPPLIVTFPQAFNPTTTLYRVGWYVELQWFDSDSSLQIMQFASFDSICYFLSSVNVYQFTYIHFECFAKNRPVFHCYYAIACGPDVEATLWGFFMQNILFLTFWLLEAALANIAQKKIAFFF